MSAGRVRPTFEGARAATAAWGFVAAEAGAPAGDATPPGRSDESFFRKVHAAKYLVAPVAEHEAQVGAGVLGAA